MHSEDFFLKFPYGINRGKSGQDYGKKVWGSELFHVTFKNSDNAFKAVSRTSEKWAKAVR